MGGERSMIEANHVTVNDGGMELGRLEIALAKLARQLSPGGIDRDTSIYVSVRPAERQNGVHHEGAASAASNSAWCSVTSASMISPRASPSSTCGSLYRVRWMRWSLTRPCGKLYVRMRAERAPLSTCPRRS